MFSLVSSSALAITNVGYGADELNDSCADEKCLNAIAELGGERTDPEVVRRPRRQYETDLGGCASSRMVCDCI
jgi:hypothetical protein